MLQDAPPAVQKMFHEMWADIQHSQWKREIERAKADPQANKLTRVFDQGVSLGYTYINAGKNRKGQSVWFCWSKERNAAGYYLAWRQVRMRKKTKRDQWCARKIRRRCKEISQKRAAVFERRPV